jgi:hypothetical protein
VSQKEKMMQVLENVNVGRNEFANSNLASRNLLDEIYAPTAVVNSVLAKQQEAKVQHMQAVKSLHRFLEANCDCV